MIREETHDKLSWLAYLRWWALVATMVGILVGMGLNWTFISPPAIAAGVVMGLIANIILLRRLKQNTVIFRREMLLHMTADLLLLLWMLSWAGGIRNPLTVVFSFHIVLSALMIGKRGAWFSTVGSALSLMILGTLELFRLLPSPVLHDPPLFLNVSSTVILLGGLFYLSIVVATRMKDEESNAKHQQEQAEQNLSLLLDALAALDIGLELVNDKQEILLSNDYAQQLRRQFPKDDASVWTCPAAPHQCRVGPEQCPRRQNHPSIQNLESIRQNHDDGQLVQIHQKMRSCRFAIADQHKTKNPQSAHERIIDMLSLGSQDHAPLRAFLYVDRTDELVVENRHMMLERLATLGRAMQGLAHELNTPLTTMRTLAKDLQAALQDLPRELPLDGKEREDFDESLHIIIEESQRCRTLTQNLLATARDGANSNAATEQRGQSALEVARRALRLVAHAQDAEGSGVLLDEKSLQTVLACDGNRVLQIVMNLVQNALNATESLRNDGKGPRVKIHASQDHAHLHLLIDDRGAGLPNIVKERLFEPFVTTKPLGEGTGLGLYTSQRIARELGGILLLEDLPPQGTRAIVSLPRGGIYENAHSAG